MPVSADTAEPLEPGVGPALLESGITDGSASVVSGCEPDVWPVQAAVDTAIARAKIQSLNAFFIVVVLWFSFVRPDLLYH